MGLEVVALLKGTGPVRGPHLGLEPLADGVLLRVSARFSGPDRDLASAVRMAAGLLARDHDDSRGVFMFPAITGLRATTYDGILAEVGEAGRWVPVGSSSDPVGDGASPQQLTDTGSSFRRLLAATATNEFHTLVVELAHARNEGRDESTGQRVEAWIERLGGREAALAYGERLAEAARAEVAAAELSGTEPDHLAMIWVEAIEAVEAHLCSILI